MSAGIEEVIIFNTIKMVTAKVAQIISHILHSAGTMFSHMMTMMSTLPIVTLTPSATLKICSLK